MKYLKMFENRSVLIDEYWEYGDLVGIIHYNMNYFKNWLNNYGDFESTDKISENLNLPVGCLKNINVYDDYRGEGYGNKILEYFIDECIDNDVKDIILVADKDEEQKEGFDLVKWYESNGFEIVGKIYDNPIMKMSI